jgi:hypothetical protein
MALRKEKLAAIREEIEKLLDKCKVDLYIDDINDKYGGFNIYIKAKKPRYFHVIHTKFEQKRDGSLWFKSSITYNIPGKRERIKKSPGYFKSLLQAIKAVSPTITTIIEKENFMKEAQYSNKIPMSENLAENSRRILIYAALKLFYTPKFGGKEAQFEERKFKMLYNSLQSSKIDMGNGISKIFNAIKTKPFIILSGISGTGKTQIARIISAGLVDKSED